MAIPSGGFYDYPNTPTNLIPFNDGSDVLNFYWVETKITGVLGSVTFDNSWLSTNHNAIFMLVETAPPNGYILPAEPDNFTFFTIHEPDVSDRLKYERIVGKPVPLTSGSFYIENTPLTTTPFPETGGIGNGVYITAYILTPLILLFFTGTLIYRYRSRRRCLNRLRC